VEARAFRIRIKEAINVGSMRLLIEGDNATVIRTLQGDASTPWQTAVLIHDVRNVLSTMAYFTISHVYRATNMADNWLSNIGQTLNAAVVWDIREYYCCTLSYMVCIDLGTPTLVEPFDFPKLMLQNIKLVLSCLTNSITQKLNLRLSYGSGLGKKSFAYNHSRLSSYCLVISFNYLFA